MKTPIIMTILSVIVISTGVAYYFTTRIPATQEAMDKAGMVENDLMVESDGLMPEPQQDDSYSGARLAGDSAPLLDFTKTDFDAAIASDKLVVLYFYANWCPICRAEFPKAEEAFNELTSDQVIGFRVNFNDNQTDDDEVALAREHGVAYQHTKVFVKNGEQVLKSPESWEKDRYLTEISNAL